MRFGVDYAWDHVPVNALRGAGASFVARYLSPDGSKNLSRGEAATLAGAGLDVVVVWESNAARALDGAAAGGADARAALAQAAAAGMPSGRPIYFAVDFDPYPNYSEIVPYLAGAAHVLGPDHTGVYGGYGTLAAAFGAGVVRFGWQTLAWSGGAVHPRAGIYQYAVDTKLGGVDCDFNHGLAQDFGQWRVGGNAKPQPGHLPLAEDGILGANTLRALQYALNHKPRAPQLRESGQFDGPTRARLLHYLGVTRGGEVAARALQHHVGAKSDGIWGPDTTRHLQHALNQHRF